jgi:hypothetical protein
MRNRIVGGIEVIRIFLGGSSRHGHGDGRMGCREAQACGAPLGKVDAVHDDAAVVQPFLAWLAAYRTSHVGKHGTTKLGEHVVAALICAVPIRVEGVHTRLCGMPHVVDKAARFSVSSGRGSDL